jgi:drug/metabolite transporter (DMT)-like permease
VSGGQGSTADGDLRILGDAATILAVLSWGAGNVLIKALEDDGLTLGFHRLWVAAAIVGSVLLLRRQRLRLSDMRIAASSGVAFGMNTVCLFMALKLTTVANAAVINGLQPVVVVFIASRWFSERLRPLDVLLAGGALLGVSIVVYGSTGLPEWHIAGDALALLSLVSWTWYFVASKRARRRLGALEHQATVAIVAAMVLAPLLLLSGQAPLPQSGGSWVGVVLLAVVPGGGHVLLSWAHAHTSLTLTSLLTLGTPVVSAIGAAIFLGEALTVVQGAGMAAVLGCLAALVMRSGAFSAPVGAPEELGRPDRPTTQHGEALP